MTTARGVARVATAAPGATEVPPDPMVATTPPRPWRRVATVAVGWVLRHRRSLVVLIPLLTLVGVAHAAGMSRYPDYVDDPGTYLSQAWSLAYEGRLSPYSYNYDHAPGGWIQIALWALLTDGFDRYDTAIGFGNECMLLAKLAAAGLLYVLARRVGLTRPGAAGATLLFALCPLELVFGRWTFLDNLVTPWLLLAFVLAYSPRRSIGAAAGAGLAFAMACLTKETALVLVPAFGWALAQNLDQRNRAYVVTVAACTGGLLLSLYPLLALYKGELFPGAGHNSLLGTAQWQLGGRESSGSVLDPHSPVRGLMTRWFSYDWLLLSLGLAATPIAAPVRRLRPVALALAIEWLMLVRGGYVPFMHVLTLTPWSALLVAGATEALAGSPALLDSPEQTRRSVARTVAAATLALAVTAGTVFAWTPTLRSMTAAHHEPALRSATSWVADNVPRDKVLVVHDAIWTDLVYRYGFRPRPIMVYKLDTDPAVRRKLDRIDYLVLPNWYFQTPDGKRKYKTALEARKHAVPVAVFGHGPDGVRVYRVSRYWKP